jgi:threonine/homoserine/homoserine lactone efflux protein
MLGEISGIVSLFWVIFSFSFLVALTGAMAPGPLLTYTIIRSVKGGKRRYLTGLWVVTGHAILEVGIVIFLLLGFSFVLRNIIVVRAIGVIGGAILVYFGLSVIRDARLGRIPTDFLIFDKLKADDETFVPEETDKKARALDNPVLGGAMVSMSNPYWWIWWATIGFAFMVQFEVSFEQWPNLLAFFIGHEAGDLAWYLLVSILSYFGLRRLNRKAYYGILVVCSVFMILFGLYLGVSPFLKTQA